MDALRWFYKPPRERRPDPEMGSVRLVPLSDLRRLHQLLTLMVCLQAIDLLINLSRR